MKEQNSIPTSKVARSMQFVKTGVKIGGNYLKYNVKPFVRLQSTFQLVLNSPLGS